MKKMILSAVMLVFAASGYAQETGAAGAGERNEWLPTFEAVAVDADLDVKFVRVPDTEAPKIVYDTKGSYTTKFRAEVKDKTLRISEKPDSRRPERTEVTVYYNALRAVSLSGAAATFVGTLDAAVLDVTVNRKASLTAKLDVKDLKMETDGTENRLMQDVDQRAESIFSPKYEQYNARVDTLESEDDYFTPAGKDLYERLRTAETQEEANKIYKQRDSLEKSRRL